MQNFSQQVQTQLSQKGKTFPQFFVAFLKYALNVEHFGKKDEYPNLIICKIIETERGSHLNT